MLKKEWNRKKKNNNKSVIDRMKLPSIVLYCTYNSSLTYKSLKFLRDTESLLKKESVLVAE